MRVLGLLIIMLVAGCDQSDARYEEFRKRADVDALPHFNKQRIIESWSRLTAIEFHLGLPLRMERHEGESDFTQYERLDELLDTHWPGILSHHEPWVGTHPDPCSSPCPDRKYYVGINAQFRRDAEKELRELRAKLKSVSLDEVSK